MAHLEEKTVSSEQKFDGRIVKLFVDKAELEDGRIVTREVIKHPGGVCVLPLTEKNEVMFVKQFRYPHQTVLLEIPAGKLEYGENHLNSLEEFDVKYKFKSSLPVGFALIANL